MTKVKKYTITNWDDVSENDIDELRDFSGLMFDRVAQAMMGDGLVDIRVYSQLHLEDPKRRTVLTYFIKAKRAALTEVSLMKNYIPPKTKGESNGTT